MNIIDRIIYSPKKDKYGYYGSWDTFTVKMTEPDAIGDYVRHLTPKEYELQLLKEKLLDEFKVPEEIIEKIVNISKEIGAKNESDANNPDL